MKYKEKKNANKIDEKTTIFMGCSLLLLFSVE